MATDLLQRLEYVRDALKPIAWAAGANGGPSMADTVQEAIASIAAKPNGPDQEGLDRATEKLRKALAHKDGHHSIGLTKRECAAVLDAMAAKPELPEHVRRIRIPTETMEQEFQAHYRRGFEAGKKAAQPEAQAGASEAVAWRPMDTAPRDGTMLRLLVRFTEHATEDNEIAPTIGAWPADGDPDGSWQFAGWCWTHDHFTEGKGEPIGWLPLLDTTPPLGAVPEGSYAGCTLWRGSLRVTVAEPESMERRLDPDQAFCDLAQRALDSLAAAWDARNVAATGPNGEGHG